MTAFTWDAAAGARTIRPLRDFPAATTTDDAYARAVWSCLTEPGDGVAGALVAAQGAPAALHDVVTGAIAHAAEATGIETPDMRDGFARWRPRLRHDTIAFAVDIAVHTGCRLIVPDDRLWPAALDDLGVHAPLCLWVKGDPAAVSAPRPAIALVGARAASGYGEHIVSEMAGDLASRGVTVVSGAAYGIDGAAHRATLGVGGNTIALLAGGLDRPYPAGHTGLLTRIARCGAVVSEVPCGSAPTRWRFLQRNRNIAALSGATVVVEAGWRSGSLNTAGHAAQLGRPLGAVPGPVTSATSAGCHRLLREYDAHCVTCADDAAELLGLDQVLDTDVTPAHDTRVPDAMSTRAWRDAADVARRSGMAPAEVTARLGAMLLDGSAETDGARWRRVAASVTS